MLACKQTIYVDYQAAALMFTLRHIMRPKPLCVRLTLPILCYCFSVFLDSTRWFSKDPNWLSCFAHYSKMVWPDDSRPQTSATTSLFGKYNGLYVMWSLSLWYQQSHDIDLKYTAQFLYLMDLGVWTPVTLGDHWSDALSHVINSTAGLMKIG